MLVSTDQLIINNGSWSPWPVAPDRVPL